MDASLVSISDEQENDFVMSISYVSSSPYDSTWHQLNFSVWFSTLFSEFLNESNKAE